MFRNLVAAALALLTAACVPIPAEPPRPVDGPAAVSEQDERKEIAQNLVAHIDILGVATPLDGETLIVTFQLRDLPETLTFNRTGVPKHALEYNWEVLIDVDNDPSTGGYLGDDYRLAASRFRHPSFGDAAVHLPIEEAVQANSWQVDPDGLSAALLSRASIEVSAEENTITLVGDIPGITSQSRLVFEAYDFLNGSEQVTCQVSVVRR